jgi:transposase-like protein
MPTLAKRYAFCGSGGCGAPVVSSLDEAGDELITFLQFPPLQWKALRTTNALERINEEFRGRTKTQASLPGKDAVLLLLYGLLRVVKLY